MKGLSKTISIDGKNLTIRELTAGEIIAWEARINAMLKSGATSATDQLLLEDFSLEDIGQMTGLSPDEIGELAPSDLEKIAQTCKEVNPRFFVVRGVLLRPLKAALELMTLAGSPASSSASGT